MGLDLETAKAGLMIVALRRVVREELESWGVDGCQAEADELVKAGAVVKVLIRHEIQKRRGTEKLGAIFFELSARYKVSESLVAKAVRGER